MSAALALDYVSAAAAAALAAAAAIRARRSLSRWALAAGMFLLAIECVFIALSRGNGTLDQIARWQDWRMITLAAVPGTWLLFSLNYARGKAEPSPFRKLYALPLAILVPSGLAWCFREQFF